MDNLKNLSKFLPILFLALYLGIAFRPFFFQGKLPIPADTIVGLYYPWRDAVVDQYPNGVPFKNSLITDAVRQEYPWRELAINQMKNGHLPLWNPYSFSGYPLAANLQSAPFYPLNILYLYNNFPLIWSIQVVLQIILGGLFMALFLKNLKLSSEAVALGVLSWVGCGFFVSWLETNMVVQSVIWLPLILFSMDKLNADRKKFWFGILLTLGFICTFLAGHLQSIFYVSMIAGYYALYRFAADKNIRKLIYAIIFVGIAALLVFPYFQKVFEFIQLSGRNLDQIAWNKPDWFLPWQNLVQFIAPDFFGNPATLNYFGVWNYAEFVGYIGLVPLYFALFAIFCKKRETIPFLIILITSLILILPTFIAKIPFQFNWPFISSSQPSRLIVMVSFSLSVLGAFGLNSWQNEKPKIKPVLVLSFLLSIIITLWLIAFNDHLGISLRNLVLPTLIFAGILFGILSSLFLPKFKKPVIICLLLLACLDSAKFAEKFLPFTSSQWLYPQTKIISFLVDKSKKELFRVSAEEDRFIPDNFSVPYEIQTASGYDPLYLMRYAELTAAINRDKPDISPPFNYNRSITPRGFNNRLYPLLNVKYFLSAYDLFNPNFEKVMQEGNTRLYEIKNFLPRAYFVGQTVATRDKQQTIEMIFTSKFIPGATAVIEDNHPPFDRWSVGTVQIIDYQPNQVTLKTKNVGDGFLVLGDSFYPGWKATVDGQPTRIYLTNFAFRGVVVPTGNHLVRFLL